MQRYNQRMVEQLKVRQQQEKARLPKIQRSEGKTRMAMYKKSLHISGAGSAAEQREKIKQVGPGVAQAGLPYRVGEHKTEGAAEGPGKRCASHTARKPHNRPVTPLVDRGSLARLAPVPSHCSASVRSFLGC